MTFKRIGLATLLFIALPFAASAAHGTYLGFQITIGNAPPPPRVVYETEPRMAHVRDSRVWALDEDPGYDMFSYGSYYYINDSGYWYRSRDYRGPYIVIDARMVPRALHDVPPEHWHHRPYYAAPERRQQGRDYRNHRDWDRDGNHRGRGRR